MSFTDPIRLPYLDGACFLIDGVLYINTDHRLAAEMKAETPNGPAINQAAFDRLRELAEANIRLRTICRESADAYQRGYTQAMQDAAKAVVQTGQAVTAALKAELDWQPESKQDRNP